MTWLIIIVMAAITYLNRFAFFITGLKYQPGQKLKRFLSFSSLAVLTAIWMPIVFEFDVAEGVSIEGLDYLIGAFLACGLSMLKVHSLITVVVSTGVFFALRSIIHP